MDWQRALAIVPETAKPLSSRNLRLCSNFDEKTRGDWHAECNEGWCATARQKATGEALFELSLAEKRSQGSEGPPHRIPDFCLQASRTSNVSWLKAVSPRMRGSTKPARMPLDNSRRIAVRRIPSVCMLFLSFPVAAAADTKSEDIVAKHLDSIGTPEARAAVKSRALQGSLHFKELIGGMGDTTGNWGYVSE